MKLTDVLISAIIKKGVLYEARNCDIGFDIPTDKPEDSEKNGNIHVQFKAEHMSLKIEKSE